MSLNRYTFNNTLYIQDFNTDCPVYGGGFGERNNTTSHDTLFETEQPSETLGV